MAPRSRRLVHLLRGCIALNAKRDNSGHGGHDVICHAQSGCGTVLDKHVVLHENGFSQVTLPVEFQGGLP
jgi:hypothetical protein